MLHDLRQPPGDFQGQSALNAELPYRTQFLWLIQGSRVVKTLLALSAGFMLLSVLGQLLARLSPGSEALQSIMRATNVDSEGNLPSLYNALLLLLPALLLNLIARATSAVNRTMRRGWRVLSLVFFYLCADEYLHIHELLMAPVRARLNVDGFLHYAWVVPYAALGLLLLAVLIPFLRRLPSPSRRAFMGAGALYLIGVMGLELVGGQLEGMLGVGNALVLPLTTLEEGLEMVGLTLFTGALLRHLQLHLPGVQLVAQFSLTAPSPLPHPDAVHPDAAQHTPG